MSFDFCFFCVCVCLSQVSGAAPPKPCTSFAHFSFDEQLMHQIRKSEYTQPTPIQCQVQCKFIWRFQHNQIYFFYFLMWWFHKEFLLFFSLWLLGCSHSSVWTWYDWYCKNWQWQNCSFYLANAGSHHGPKGTGGRRRANRSHCVSHQRALSAGKKQEELTLEDLGFSVN